MRDRVRAVIVERADLGHVARERDEDARQRPEQRRDHEQEHEAGLCDAERDLATGWTNFLFRHRN